MSEFEDKMNEADKVLWEIIDGQIMKPFNKIKAIEQLRLNNKEVFEKMFDAGIFEKHLGTAKLQTVKDIVEYVTFYEQNQNKQGRTDENGDKRLADKT